MKLSLKIASAFLCFTLAACASKHKSDNFPKPTKPSFSSAEEHLESVRKALDKATQSAEKIDILIQSL